MGATLGLVVTAEGIETREHAERAARPRLPARPGLHARPAAARAEQGRRRLLRRRAGSQRKREPLATSLRTARAAARALVGIPQPHQGARMRRSSILGRGDGRRPGRRHAGGDRRQPARATARRRSILGDPTADNTDLYAFTAPDAPGSLTVVAELDPVRGSVGRPVLRQARSEGALLRQDRQHRRRPRGRRLPLAVQARSSATRTRSCTRRRRSTRSTIRTSTSSRRTTSTGRRTTQRQLKREQADRERPAGRAGQRRAEDDPRLRQGLGGRRQVAARAAASRSSARPTTRSSSTSPPSSTASTSTSRAGPDIGLGNQGGGKDDVAGYNTHSFVLQVPESEVTRDGRSVSGAERQQRRRRRLGDDRAQADQRAVVAPQAASAASARLGAGQPPRQPADQRGRHPDRR